VPDNEDGTGRLRGGPSASFCCHRVAAQQLPRAGRGRCCGGSRGPRCFVALMCTILWRWLTRRCLYASRLGPPDSRPIPAKLIIVALL
jgi:hypothetical protein